MPDYAWLVVVSDYKFIWRFLDDTAVPFRTQQSYVFGTSEVVTLVSGCPLYTFET